VWQFSNDGSPEEIVDALAAHSMAVLIKTHDGTNWMAEYDDSPDAVTGPERVTELAQYFEARGVPFHAWAVVKGTDPEREAEMAAEVLAAGARSLTLDLEPWGGFWVGTDETARQFGEELRRRQPEATIVTALDPRPWLEGSIPLSEFASFSDALAPLIYWETFNNAANFERFESAGIPPGDGGITAEFLLDAAAEVLEEFHLPLQPVGQGASPDMDAWARFLDHGADVGIESASAWRHGVTEPQVWEVLLERTPHEEPYVVQPGDTLSALAHSWGVSLESIVQRNQITDPNFIRQGQLLCIPLG
jgi:hypothetical protein